MSVALPRDICSHNSGTEALPCSHRFCRLCIREVALKAGGATRPFPCPDCGTETLLPTSFFVGCMKEQEFVPEVTEDVETHAKVCARHKNKPLEWYCFSCYRFICSACTLKDHRDHNYEFVEVAAEETKNTLPGQLLDPLRQWKTDLLCALEKIQFTKLQVEEQGQCVVNSVRKHFEELRRIIEKRECELLSETIAEIQRKLKLLSAQERELCTLYSAARSTIDYTKWCVRKLGDEELLCANADIKDRVRRLEEEREKNGAENLEPVEEVDVGFEASCAADLEQLCRTKAAITKLHVDAAQCTLVGDGIRFAEVSKISEFQVLASLSNGLPTRKGFSITCSATRLKVGGGGGGRGDECKFRVVGDWVQYKPTRRGVMEISVKVDGQEIPGSPFPVFVSADPTKLNEPIDTIDKFLCPKDMALTEMGDVIVTEVGKSMLPDTTTTTRRVYYKITFDFVAVCKSSGFIYVTDSNKIFRLNLTDIVNTFIIPINKHVSKAKTCFRGIHVVGDEVMVCERDRGVMVYDELLLYRRQVGSCGDGPNQFGQTYGISSDSDGNLYISDQKKFCVHVIGKDGSYLRSFGQERLQVVPGDASQELPKRPDLICYTEQIFGGHAQQNASYNPLGVCVAGQYVYVTNPSGGTHAVLVFSLVGDFVGGIGKRGRSCDSANSVCVDRNGLVYICDYKKGEVVIF